MQDNRVTVADPEDSLWTEILTLKNIAEILEWQYHQKNLRR